MAAPKAARSLSGRFASVIPPDVLQDGEIVLLMAKPSPLFVLLGSLRSSAALAFVAMLLATMNNAALDLGWMGLGGRSLRTGLDSRDILLAGAGLIGLRWFWQLLEWLSHVYLLTDRRVIRARGVLGVSVIEVPLARLRQLEAHAGFKERLFGLGSITLGDGGGLHAEWSMLDRPQEVFHTVRDAVRRYGGGPR